MASGKNPFGISAASPALDLGRTVAWKDRIVGRLTTGVSGLLKRAGVKSIAGWARFRDGKTVEVETETGQPGDPRRGDRHRHRLEAGRARRPAVRRRR